MRICAVDIETYDPNLKELGPGDVRKDGYILGVGMYSKELNIEGYYDVSEPIVKDILADEDILKVFHNAVYDTNWLVNGYGLKINNVDDTMTRETLLDAYASSYSLDACCVRRGLTGKNKGDTIDKYWTGKGKAIQNLHRIPREIVAKYCIQDCIATYNLWQAQQPLLTAQGLDRANEIEKNLYPVLWLMRKNGIRVDWAYRDKLSKDLNSEYNAGVAELEHKYGIVDLSFSKAAHMEKMWRAEGIPVQTTATGRPSFTKEIIANTHHPLAQKVLRLKKVDKLLGTFIDGSLVTNEVNGKIHCVFYPAKRDDGGTVTGRWSSQHINMQQQPRDGWYRDMFIPEENCYLGAFDYKQIEYRVFAHFATGPGSEEVKSKYNNDPLTDYHQMTVDIMGWNDMGKHGRILAKNFSFGSLYGLGLNSFVDRFTPDILHSHPELDPDDAAGIRATAEHLRNEYFGRVPFVKTTCDLIQKVGKNRGYVTTVAGRRQRMPKDNAAYKLINYLIQGSAADILKKGMADAYNAGVFNTLIPHLTVHDEVVFSLPKTLEGAEAAIELQKCMENAYKLDVPIAIDTEIGTRWGNCNEATYKEFMNGFELF